MNRVIILLGQRVRSGTNFVGSTLSKHPNVVTFPPDKSLGEFNLYNDAYIVSEVFNKVVKKSFGLHLSEADLSIFLKYYGECWLKLLKKKHSVNDDAILFLKSPKINHIDLWQNTFPDAQISIICRDGRDNVISSVKASNDNRSWYTLKKKLKKSINYYSGRSFINHSKAWSRTAKSLINIKPSKNIKIFKYESLIDSKDGINSLLDHFKLKTNDDIIKNCLNAPVIGSSFGVKTDSVNKTNWLPDYDKSKYNFTLKWGHWGFIKKAVFKQLAGKALIDLDYEKNMKW